MERTTYEWIPADDVWRVHGAWNGVSAVSMLLWIKKGKAIMNFEDLVQGLTEESKALLYAYLKADEGTQKQMYRTTMIQAYGSAAARAILERMKEHPEEENAILDEAEAEALKDDSFQQYILKEEKENDQ